MSNFCGFHNDNEAVNQCEECKKFLCEMCWKIYNDSVVCTPCRKKAIKRRVIKQSIAACVVVLFFMPLFIKYRLPIGLWIAGKERLELSSKKIRAEEYESLFLRGKTMRMLRKFPAAIKAFKKCTEILPNKIEARQELGECYLNMSMSVRAEKEFVTVLGIDSNNIRAFLQLADIYWNRKEQEKAIQTVGKSAKINSGSIEPLKKLINYLTSEKKYYSRAIEVYSKLILLEPSNDENYYKRGLLYKTQKKWKEAVADLEKAIKLDPSYTNARIYLARSYYEQGNCAKAFSSLDSFRGIYPMLSWSDSLIMEYKKYKKCSSARLFKKRNNI